MSDTKPELKNAHQHPTTTAKNVSAIQMKDFDIYRDTFLRYMGYSNEVGEALRPLVPKTLVAGSYGIAIGYVCTDTFDKGLREQMAGAGKLQVAQTAADVFIWQMLASVVVPGFVINRITATSKLLLKKAPNIAVKTLPTVIGLASIPFIVHPIDHLIDRLMDATFRKIEW